MPTPPRSQLPSPSDWDEFEDIVADLYVRRWGDRAHAQRYGRPGQAQQGVDIYGQPEHLQGGYAGIQCKRLNVGTLTLRIVRNEIQEAEAFEPPLSEYIIATTDQRDSDLQQAIRQINEEREAAGEFSVHIEFWENICARLTHPDNADLLRKHYPDWFHSPQVATSASPSLLSHLRRWLALCVNWWRRVFSGRVDETRSQPPSPQAQEPILSSESGVRANRVAIDLGTSNVRVFVEDQGVVLDIPSVIAISVQDENIVAVGEEARNLIGRAPEGIRVLRPLKEGVVSGERAVGQLLRCLLCEKLGISNLEKVRLLLTVSHRATELQRLAVLEAASGIGVGQVNLVHASSAAALGAGCPVSAQRGFMIVSLGGGVSEASMIAGGRVVSQGSTPVGGSHLDKQIIHYVAQRYNLVIGQMVAENIKIRLGSAIYPKQLFRMEVSGQMRWEDLPRTIWFNSEETLEAISGTISEMVEHAKSVLMQAGPELQGDILEYGIALTGGTALLPGIAELVKNHTGVPVWVAENPMQCAIFGAGKILESRYEGIEAFLIDESF